MKTNGRHAKKTLCLNPMLQFFLLFTQSVNLRAHIGDLGYLVTNDEFVTKFGDYLGDKLSDNIFTKFGGHQIFRNFSPKPSPNLVTNLVISDNIVTKFDDY